MNGDSTAARLCDLLPPHVVANGNGVSVRINYVCEQAHCGAVLGNAQRIVLSETAVTALCQALNAENVTAVHEQFEDGAGGIIAGRRLGTTAVSIRLLLKHP